MAVRQLRQAERKAALGRSKAEAVWDCPEKVDTWLLVQAAFEAAARCSN